MRFGTRSDGRLCLMDAQGMTLVLDGQDGPAYETLQDLIEVFDDVSEELGEASQAATHHRQAWSETTWTAPIPRPDRNVFCVGKNYVEHAAEFHNSGFDAAAANSNAVPEFPIIFTKTPESVIGPEDTIIVPSGLTQMVDYEAEIAVVIGKVGRFISASDAMDHVFGFTLINDVTARDLQQRHKQWFLGKAIETFCPMGPFVVTKDAVDLSALVLRCEVNAELRQEAPATDMIFDIPTIIETLSQSVELLPGDVIATGTPAGVGVGMTPPKFLAHGDVVTVSATGLGSLTNTVEVV